MLALHQAHQVIILVGKRLHAELSDSNLEAVCWQPKAQLLLLLASKRVFI